MLGISRESRYPAAKMAAVGMNAMAHRNRTVAAESPTVSESANVDPAEREAVDVSERASERASE